MEFEKIRSIIAEYTQLDEETITLDSTLEDLKIDSLDMVEIIMDIEDQFDVSIDSAEGIKTVGDLVDYISK